MARSSPTSLRLPGLVFRHHEDLTEMQPVGGGVLALDYNGDGLHDAYLTDSLGPNALFRNNGDGTFTDVAEAAGVADPDSHSNGGCAADYDNDGDQDLYVTNHGPSRLFRNEGDGTFTDASDPGWSRLSGPVAQVDGLRLGGLRPGRFTGPSGGAPLPRADVPDAGGGRVSRRGTQSRPPITTGGDGSFTDVTELLGHTLPPSRSRYGEPLGNIWGAGFQPGWLDYDDDGDSDLYVANDWGTFTNPNVLWRNDGPGG